MNNKLTDEEFWISFWQNVKLPKKADMSYKNDFQIGSHLIKYVKARKATDKSIEIGCAPGKWVIFASEFLGYSVSGIEYVPSAAEVTRDNLKICNVEGNIITSDFFNFHPAEKYDLVMSHGFIEHFENIDDVFKRHLDLLNKDGYLAISIPRFKGINYIAQRLIDPFMERPYLKSHVLSVMDLIVFKNLAIKYNLEICFLDYVGGFEPSLFPLNEVTNQIFKFFVRVFIKISSILFGKVNSGMTSSFQMMILKKKT